MIRKITSVPAARFGLRQRGAVKPGYRADVVVFDPDGISFVIVTGGITVEHNTHTGARAGQVLRRGA